jgi:predicted DNA-binding transcriptional regulator YafY
VSVPSIWQCHDLLRSYQETLKTINVQGHAYESFDQEQKQKFDAITQAIALLKVLQFDYTKSNQEKHTYTVEPYRLINNKGIWYLAAKDRDKLKSFAISRIEALQISKQHYKFDPNVGAELDEEDSIWLGQKTTVILKVTGNAKQYFKRRQLVPKQRLLSEAEDCLMVSTQIAHENQLLPIVRYWIPDVEIIEPNDLKKKNEKIIFNFIDGYKNEDFR